MVAERNFKALQSVNLWSHRFKRILRIIIDKWRPSFGIWQVVERENTGSVKLRLTLKVKCTCDMRNDCFDLSGLCNGLIHKGSWWRAFVWARLKCKIRGISTGLCLFPHCNTNRSPQNSLLTINLPSLCVYIRYFRYRMNVHRGWRPSIYN